MIKINEIPNNDEPRKKIVPKLETCFKGATKSVLMHETQSAFLCGLLETYRPKKILEVGVAAGGSTAIILQTLEDIASPYEMHSVDLHEKHWEHKEKNIGFLAEIAKENNLFAPPQSTLCGKHEFHRGKYLPQVIDEIGSDIDFVILDTVHWMPGENLDFLVMLPYLTDGAVVVLHDIMHNYSKPIPLSYATTALFSAVVSEEKFLNYPPKKSYPNIGAFRISKETRTHIENLFLVFMLNWYYLPKDSDVKIYRDFYNRHYPAKLVEIFDESLRLNREYKNKFPNK